MVYPPNDWWRTTSERGIIGLDGVERAGRRVFLEEVSRAAPRCVRDLLELLPLALTDLDPADAPAKVQELRAAVRAWKERWRLRAEWVDRAAFFTLMRAHRASEQGTPLPDQIAYPDENDPEDVGLFGFSPRFFEYRGRIANYRGWIALEYCGQPTTHPWESVEAVVRAEVDRQLAEARRLYEAKTIESEPVKSKKADHFRWLARYLVGRDGKGESVYRIAKSLPRQGEPNTGNVSRQIDQAARALQLTLDRPAPSTPGPFGTRGK